MGTESPPPTEPSLAALLSGILDAKYSYFRISCRVVLGDLVSYEGILWEASL
jgi:hypothetical protein